MSRQYIEIDKTDAVLFLAWCAAVFAYYAWKDAAAARHAATPDPEPITVSGGKVVEDSEDADE